MTLAQIVEKVGEVIGDSTDGCIKWIKQFADAITGNPIILFFVIMSAVGLGVGLLRRLISVN